MKHSKYKKPIPAGMQYLDVYRVCQLFNINDPSGATQHALKKLLCSGQRGAKDRLQDLREARDSIEELLKMEEEFAAKEPVKTDAPVEPVTPENDEVAVAYGWKLVTNANTEEVYSDNWEREIFNGVLYAREIRK